eukprot:2674005-Prymnesium_polylepis.1
MVRPVFGKRKKFPAGPSQYTTLNRLEGGVSADGPDADPETGVTVVSWGRKCNRRKRREVRRFRRCCSMVCDSRVSPRRRAKHSEH